VQTNPYGNVLVSHDSKATLSSTVIAFPSREVADGISA
jgi:hypothetical protein